MGPLSPPTPPSPTRRAGRLTVWCWVRTATSASTAYMLQVQQDLTKYSYLQPKKSPRAIGRRALHSWPDMPCCHPAGVPELGLEGVRANTRQRKQQEVRAVRSSGLGISNDWQSHKRSSPRAKGSGRDDSDRCRGPP